MPRAAWGLAVWLAVTAMARPAVAQFEPLAPIGGPPRAQPPLPFDPNPTGQLPPEPTENRTRGSSKIPNVLGPPVLGAPVRPADSEQPREPEITPAGYNNTPRRRVAALGAPATARDPLPSEVVEPAVQPAYSPPNPDPVDDLLTTRRRERQALNSGIPEQRSSQFGEKFGEKIGDTFNSILGERCDWFKSDHCFDGFISPVSNPFLFEDPRSVTEVRPIFLFQSIPSRQPDFQGGNIWFFGTQARVAFTDRISMTINKLGGISVNPGSGSAFQDETGFAELWLGGKYTIIRGEETGSLLAAGLQFQVPVGSQGAFQSTGTLSLVPWLTYAQNFGRDFRIGSFNAMVGTGYSASVNNQRSSYYWLSAHLDLDLWNNHKFYPLTEMNWYLYTTDGNTLPVATEGRDLFNLGGQAKGQGLLTWAFGARYKITEAAQLGGAFEFPLAGPKGMFNYRFTIDFILRY